MFKKQLLSVLCGILVLTFCSCSGSEQKTKDKILDKAEKYTHSIDIDTTYDYQNSIGDWFEAETSYFYDENEDTSNGITNLSSYSYILNNDRLYFQISKSTPNSSEANSWAYISLKTGEKHYMCPDLLCEHIRDSGCRYINLETLTFNPDSDSKVYTVKSVWSDAKLQSIIYEIDLNNNSISEKYKNDIAGSEADDNRFELLFIHENILYFTDEYVYKKKTDKGEIIKTKEVFLKALNLSDKSNKAVEILKSNYKNDERCLYVSEGQMFLVNWSEKRFYTTDMNFENENTILTFDEDSQIYDIYYDGNTDEFYVLIGSYSLHNSSDANNNGKGKLYRVTGNFRYEEVPMPSEQILDFQLTNEYIYYTVYDPIRYGTSPRGGTTCDESGNKIYRVKRNDTVSSELVFDGHGEMQWGYDGYIITGNCLYIDYYSIIKQGGLVWFRGMGSSARINIKDETIKWINLD